MNITIKTLKTSIDVHIYNFIKVSIDEIMAKITKDTSIRIEKKKGVYNYLPYFEYRFINTKNDTLIGDMNIRFHLLEETKLSTSLYSSKNKMKAIIQTAFGEIEELIEGFDEL